MTNIAPFIPKYVRLLHSENDSIEIPYSETQFGVVVMVDIVGFSKLTTLASEKSQSGAEAISMEIGAYMGECIQVIEYFGGDVVKFLGDAVLVCFQQNLGGRRPSVNSSIGSEDTLKSSNERIKSRLVRKAIECSLQLISRLSHYQIYLTAEERSRRRRSSATAVQKDQETLPKKTAVISTYDTSKQENTALEHEDKHPEEKNATGGSWRNFNFFSDKRKKSTATSSSTSRCLSASSDKSSNREKGGIELELHIGLSCGDVTNIVIGDIGSDTFPFSGYTPPLQSPCSIEDQKASPDNGLLEYKGRLEYTIGGPVVDALDITLSIAKAGELCITQQAFEIAHNQLMNLEYELRNNLYIVRSPQSQLNPKKAESSLRSKRVIFQQSFGDHLEPPNIFSEPLVPRTRNADLQNIAVDTNPHYFKYLSRSSLYRLQYSESGELIAQFRDATIMFISLGKVEVDTEEGLNSVQKAFLACLNVLSKYEGMLQQFAIDDKGATALAVFGLPPFSHECEATFAAKAAIELRDEYMSQNLKSFAISLATDIIFTAVVPKNNIYRRDPGIAGDSIVLAVRLLKVNSSQHSVVCDLATRQQLGNTCEFIDLGEKIVKGKSKPIRVYEISNFEYMETKRYSMQSMKASADFIGYGFEKEEAADFFREWNREKDHHTLVISGAPGVGKSYFCKMMYNAASQNNIVCCWSTTTEVEKSSKFYLIRNLMLILFEKIDSENFPSTDLSNRPSLGNESSGTSYTDSFSLKNCSGSPDFSIRSAYSTHIIGYNEWSKRPTSYPSNSSTSSASFKAYHEINQGIIDLIKRCLVKCGESKSYLPLFKIIFTTLSEVKENKQTNHLDGRARDLILCGVITRMINYASRQVSLLLVCDDVQWADSASVTFLQKIHESCKNIMLLIASRPIQDYNLTFMKVFSNFGKYRNICLSGLNQADIGEVIMQTFGSGVTKISLDIVKIIQKRTSGNPLYVKSLAITLKDFNHVTVVDKKLVYNNNSALDLYSFMGNLNYMRLIKMQYDKLNAEFQEFLAIASCLDQTFSMQEILVVISKNNRIFKDTDAREIWGKIKFYDIYNFLQKSQTEDLADERFEVYTFYHITIPQCIYDRISYEKRIATHSMFADYYETMLTNENCHELLGKITRHYLGTNIISKQLEYLEKSADFNMNVFLIPEATSNLQNIVKILNANEDVYNNFGQIHMSDICRKLGQCFTARTKFDEGEHYLTMALDHLSEPWPKTEFQFLWKYWKNRADQYRHRKFGSIKSFKGSDKIKIWKRIIDIMKALSSIYFYKGNGRGFMYTCIAGLNICESLDEGGPDYALFLARNALLSWMNDKKEKSIFYISKSLRIIDKCVDPGTLLICAHLCFAAGKYQNARGLLYRSIEASQTLGVIVDFQSFYCSVGLLVTMGIFQGNLNSSEKDMGLLKRMATTAHNNGDYEVEVWIGVYNIANAIVMNNLDDCLTSVSLIEAHISKTQRYNCIAIHGTLACYYAKIKNHEMAQFQIQALLAIIPEFTKTPNIFPILGLIFVIMGLAIMIEDHEVDITGFKTAENYEKFIQGIIKINHAFQLVKYWEFTQPCLYLARALPFILTNRIVEGYTVLNHGISEMHYIEEISFLKAYYWSFLGKYAFKSSERINWTDKAIKEFRHLGIPYSIYCNPSPEKSNVKGTIASLVEINIAQENS
ncbi:hypothetical protein BDF14DRAFT_1762829 [Spinellus fusiger]|nr:hypothetical protein BDF14DRAFT_1762829 [Spinellus fusiger]